LTDRELLDLLRGGRRDAFDTLFHAHYPRLVGLAESMLHDRGAAEEVVQDVMLELWRRRESLRLQTSLSAYLYRSTRNRALNHIRHARVQRRAEPFLIEDAASPPATDRDALQDEIDAALRAAVAGLPERCRQVFELSRVNGLRYAEIAETMGISIKTVEAQMGKALRILRERLAAWLPDPDT
jgi:RNA polymerase sigma-70 factor (ECF subfamily)